MNPNPHGRGAGNAKNLIIMKLYSMQEKPKFMKNIFIIILVLSPIVTIAQRPKMHIKLFGGVNTSKLVYKVEDVDSDVLTGWQAGGSIRIDRRNAFVETGVAFADYGITVYLTEDADLNIREPFNLQMRTIEVPMLIGYVPVKKPVFKWFLYGGLSNRFSLKGRYTYKGEEGTFRPKEAELHFYNLGGRFGTQIDIAMFNFDLNYTIGITNGFRNRVRTNTHTFQLSVGILF